MNDYQIIKDIDSICELLNISIDQLADELHLTPATIHHWRKKQESIEDDKIELIYDYAYRKGIRLNKIKEQFYKETDIKSKILFHGAKSTIEGQLSLSHSKAINDFGKGFYCGESEEQSVAFVSNYPNSSLYIFELDITNLSSYEFHVNQEWMLTIAYFRGRLNQYGNHPLITGILKKIAQIDCIIAPIADNKMFEIIDSFIDGEITDVTCQHCLSATDLGKQYVFKTEKALQQLKIKQHCYLCQREKEESLMSKIENIQIRNDKVRLAKREYRNQGNYIEDILK